ncbi:hypothetical protein ACTYEO_02955 [Rhodophyticola sp. SM2404]
MTHEARAALLQRQGSGARYDAPCAPAQDLAWMRAGTAYFNRLLNELSDAALDEAPPRGAQSRRMIISQTGYHARHLAEMAQIFCGEEDKAALLVNLTLDSVRVQAGAALPARALRHLVEHTGVHLNVVLRDMRDADWKQIRHDPDRTAIPATLLPRLRARLLWKNALDLRAGGRLSDAPEGLELK